MAQISSKDNPSKEVMEEIAVVKQANLSNILFMDGN